MYHNAQLALPLQIASIMILLTVLFNVGLSALVGLGKTKEAAISDLLYSTAQLAAVAAAALLRLRGLWSCRWHAGWASWPASPQKHYFSGRAIGSIATKLSKSVMKQILGFSLPVFASDISTMGLTNFAVLFLGVFARTSIVGNYGVAFKLGTAFQVVTVLNSFHHALRLLQALDRTKLSKHMKGIYAEQRVLLLPVRAALLAYLVLAQGRSRTCSSRAATRSRPAYFIVIAIGITIGML